MIDSQTYWSFVSAILLLCVATPSIAQQPPRADPPAQTPMGNAPATPAEPETVAPAETDKAERTETVDSAGARDELPLASETLVPSAEELLSSERHDWVILTDDKLLVVEPVYPRPETLKQIEQERQAIQDDRAKRASKAGRARLNELNYLNIFLPGEGDTASEEFRLPLKDIREIVLHEDLMLRRAGQLIDEGKTREAFELVIVVARGDPDWPGLLEIRNRMAVADAERFLKEGQLDQALAMIASLYEQEPIPTQANTLLDQVADALVGTALEAQDGRRARFAIERIRQVKSGHPAVARWTKKLTEHAESLRQQAEQASGEDEHAQAAMLIQQAAETWPPLGGLTAVHARLTDRYQILTVGVPAVVAAKPSAISTIAERRVSRLRYADLFELDQFTSLPSYRSIYLERWEPTDLGRRAHFELRSQLPAWSARSALTASQIIDLLSARFRPGSPDYDARFANTVAALRLEGPFEFEVEFRRIPQQTEAALAFGTLLSSAVPPAGAEAFTRFQETERSDRRVAYTRANPLSEEGARAVSRVVEIAFPSYEKAIQALDRGEVRMLTNIPVWDVPRLREDERFVVTRLAVPHTHLIQFHPNSQTLKSTELRRALATSASAADLLRLVAGEQSADAKGEEQFGRLVTAPFPSTHSGYNAQVTPRKPDLALALALALAAENQLSGKIPPLVFAIPSHSPAREAAIRLAETWRRIGLTVELVEFDQIEESTSWDLAYREMAIADPVRSLGPLITLDPAVEVESLIDLPDWLRQRLLDLERASDAATSQAILLDLHRQLAADVRCIPLFEIDQVLVSRGPIPGLPENPVAVYQNVERWRLPQDYPEATTLGNAESPMADNPK